MIATCGTSPAGSVRFNRQFIISFHKLHTIFMKQTHNLHTVFTHKVYYIIVRYYTFKMKMI